MNVPHLRHWFAGIALSLLLAWAAGAFFLDTVQPVIFDVTIARYAPRPGTTYRMRSEGWASSHVGEHGTRGLPNGKIPTGQKVVFWGDSYVEGLQVNDPERMDQQFTQLATQAGLNLSGVGIGVAGDSLTDSLFRFPSYKPLFHSLALNVFFLAKLTDILPNRQQPGHSRFDAGPPFRLIHEETPHNKNNMVFGPAIRYLELDSAYFGYKRLQTAILQLTLFSTTQASLPIASHSQALQYTAAWDFLLHEIQERTTGPLLLVYAPTTPYIRGGSLGTTDPNATTAAAFAAACGRNGVPFLNLGPAFLAHYQATGRFPRGFFNTPPGSGHLNADGHRMVAEAVVQYITEHPHALLAR